MLMSLPILGRTKDSSKVIVNEDKKSLEILYRTRIAWESFSSSMVRGLLRSLGWGVTSYCARSLTG